MLAKPWCICGCVSRDPAAYTRQKQPLIALALRLRLSRARARTPTRILDPDPDPSPEPLALPPTLSLSQEMVTFEEQGRAWRHKRFMPDPLLQAPFPSYHP